ncbi:MAG: hypothetical protein AAGC60_11290 [Acidobacteriota bacterium]
MRPKPHPTPRARRDALVFALVLAVAGLISPPASAEPCSLDAVPAATLLLPYFEVDLGADDCVTTLFSVNNASAAPTVAHVTLWTDFSVPTIDFDIFLTGYDVATVNLRDVFLRGVLPRTADQSRDPDDTISPAGMPGWDGDIPNCDPILPFDNPAVNATLLDRLQNGHTGRPTSFDGGLCLGWNHGDNLARGYLTIDDVNNCNLLFPGSSGYFADGGTATASNDNQLWGDFFVVDPAAGFAQGMPLVHLEAYDTFEPGDYTFYGRYVNGTATDDREPLSGAWAARYLNVSAFAGGTDLLVWRDSKTDLSTASGVVCGDAPPWFPLPERQVIAFDEQENPAELCIPDPTISPPPPDPACLPLETQRVGLLAPIPGAPGEPMTPPFAAGWLLLDLGHTGNGLFGESAQSWVASLHNADGLFSVGLSALSLTSACDAPLTPLFD